MVTQEQIAAELDVNPSYISRALRRVPAKEKRGRTKFYDAEDVKPALAVFFAKLRDDAAAKARARAEHWQARIDAAGRL